MATTTAVAEPLSTLVPRKQMFVSSSGEPVGRVSRRVELLDRQRLAGQAGLDDEQVLAGDEPHVGGDHVAGGELDHVAGHQFAQRHFLGLAVADDRGGDADHRLELGGGRVGPGLLDEPQHHAEDHHQPT